MASKSKVTRFASLLGWLFKGTALVITLAYRALVLCAEGVFWAMRGLAWVIGFGRQAYRTAQVARTGALRCPDGHEVPVARLDVVHACSACGFRYRGSPLLCPNAECESPIASYVSCPTCGLSVHSVTRGR